MAQANELRKDYILDNWVIISPARKKRPRDFKKKEEEVKEGICYFCPGNEHLTPPEISRVEENGRWIIRCFPNKFPAVSLEGGSAHGEHEIVVETNEHGKELEDLSVDHLVKVLDFYSWRIEKLKSKEGVEYVVLFRNKGKEAGASFTHTHAQLISLPLVPPIVKEKIAASKKYADENGTCPYCDILKKEMGGERRILEDENACAFAPFASRFPFEAWIMPKRHIGRIGSMNEDEKRSFAKVFKKIMLKLRSMLGDPDYNLLFYLAPAGDELHFHLEICPRIAKWAGFEFGSGIIINTMGPEDAAGFYRD
ncbi:MAG: hypothetical protein A7316_11065 [Candidatus Altiarchaeales archaeon WOR_SM1_86-2]|nr:MAG: hypothetical protein A7316_11065 [Candidatus Altiarchaeales archaeon WOR_SM1_86-2]